MGRPRKNENEARDVRFTFRMTATQAETFKRQASEMGMSPSTLARAAAMGMKQIYITGELLDEMKCVDRKSAAAPCDFAGNRKSESLTDRKRRSGIWTAEGDAERHAGTESDGLPENYRPESDPAQVEQRSWLSIRQSGKTF